MKFYYVVNARMPSEKAHGIQIAKMCEAFIEAGLDITLIAPKRRGSNNDLASYYSLRVPIPIRFLPAIDLYTGGPLGYRISSYFFMKMTVLYLWWKRLQGERFSIYTVDLDNFSSSALPLVGVPVYSEMHGGKPKTFSQWFLFKYLRGTIAINALIVKELKQKFKYSHTAYLVQPNGVDSSRFSSCNKEESRLRLSIPEDEKIVLYAGRFFAWKGLESLVGAAKLSPQLSWYMVGGTKEYFTHITGVTELPANMVFKGDQPYLDMPYWIGAADALVVLGTVRDQQSYWYTSPMKLFEYLLSERPIVASKTPAIQEIVTDRQVLFYEPDNAQSLAEAAIQAVLYPEESKERILQALTKGRGYSWKARAEAIIGFITIT